MGGMHGFGPVTREEDEPVFHARWEGHVRGIFNSTAGRLFHLDEFRHAIERMPPDRYLHASYYEKWLAGLEMVLLERGVVSKEELAAGHAQQRDEAARVQASKPPAGLAPLYRPGDRVRARNLNPVGHTRLPRYARGKVGVVRLVHGPHLLPDTNAHRTGTDWEHVYSVAFPAPELWGRPAAAADSVCIDLWESYLESGE
jgi:nitrile hydratase